MGLVSHVCRARIVGLDYCLWIAYCRKGKIRALWGLRGNNMQPIAKGAVESRSYAPAVEVVDIV